jgi:hypothetical protein
VQILDNILAIILEKDPVCGVKNPFREDNGLAWDICLREFSVGVFDRLSLSRPHFSRARRSLLGRAQKAPPIRSGSRRLDAATLTEN